MEELTLRGRFDVLHAVVKPDGSISLPDEYSGRSCRIIIDVPLPVSKDVGDNPICPKCGKKTWKAGKRKGKRRFECCDDACGHVSTHPDDKAPSRDPTVPEDKKSPADSKPRSNYRGKKPQGPREKCPKCGSINTRKAGVNDGRQRWKCKDCDKGWYSGNPPRKKYTRKQPINSDVKEKPPTPEPEPVDGQPPLPAVYSDTDRQKVLDFLISKTNYAVVVDNIAMRCNMSKKSAVIVCEALVRQNEIKKRGEDLYFYEKVK
ncbi:MAG: hypothetical protein V3V59_01540 [Thermodesulfovibrionales bacterium]